MEPLLLRDDAQDDATLTAQSSVLTRSLHWEAPFFWGGGGGNLGYVEFPCFLSPPHFLLISFNHLKVPRVLGCSKDDTLRSSCGSSIFSSSRLIIPYLNANNRQRSLLLSSPPPLFFLRRPTKELFYQAKLPLINCSRRLLPS